MLQFGQILPDFGQKAGRRPLWPQIGPILPYFGPKTGRRPASLFDKFGRDTSGIGRMSTNFGPKSARFVQLGPESSDLARIRPNWAPDFGKAWPRLVAGIRLNLARNQPAWSNFGPPSAEIVRLRPMFFGLWPNLGHPECGTMIIQERCLNNVSYSEQVALGFLRCLSASISDCVLRADRQWLRPRDLKGLVALMDSLPAGVPKAYRSTGRNSFRACGAFRKNQGCIADESECLQCGALRLGTRTWFRRPAIAQPSNSQWRSGQVARAPKLASHNYPGRRSAFEPTCHRTCGARLASKVPPRHKRDCALPLALSLLLVVLVVLVSVLGLVLVLLVILPHFYWRQPRAAALSKDTRCCLFAVVVG